jgi:predicted dehydrogenase
MQDRPIGIGVIGCGKIAQMMHLPFIHELSDFRIAALCDISPTVVDTVATLYGVTGRYTDYADLLADPNVDAVVICNYDHGKVVADALAAGKHMIVEKPLAFTPQEAGELVKKAENSGLVALIGYMKFYDQGYTYGLEKIAAIGKPKSVHVHDFAGRFDPYDKLYTLHSAKDVPLDVMTAERQAIGARIDAALGADHAGYRDLYIMLLMLGSHDLAVLRGAFGTPEKIEFAKAIGPTHIFAVLEYAGGVTCMLEVAFGAQYEWWDEWIEVHGEKEEVRIEFNHPYVRNAPATVRIREPIDGMASERTVKSLPDDAFRREWQHFADCINNGETPKVPIAGGLDDLDLAVAIIKRLPPLPRYE